VPEQRTAPDRRAAREHDRRNAVALQDRFRQRQHGAIAVVESDEHRARRKRRAEGERSEEIVRADRIAALANGATVLFERRDGHVKWLERLSDRRSGAQAVITENGRPWKVDRREPARVEPRSMKDRLPDAT